MYELAFKILDNIDPHYKKDLQITEINNDNTNSQILS